MNLNELLDNLIEKKIINKKDREVMKLCLLLLQHGWKAKNKIRKQVYVNDRKFEEWWNNLEKAGYFAEDGKIFLEELDSDIPIYIMSLVAEGYIQRSAR